MADSVSIPNDGGKPRVELDIARMGIQSVKKAIGMRLKISGELCGRHADKEFFMAVLQRLREMKVGWDGGDEKIEKETTGG